MKTSEQCGGKKKGEERRNDENKFHARGKGKERKGGGGNGNSICGDIPKRIAERVVFPRKIQNRGAALFLTNGERERGGGGKYVSGYIRRCVNLLFWGVVRPMS